MREGRVGGRRGGVGEVEEDTPREGEVDELVREQEGGGRVGERQMIPSCKARERQCTVKR